MEEPKEVCEQRFPSAKFALMHEVDYEHAE
jgi:hypothetical protein